MIRWSILNDRGLEILGNTHIPDSTPSACVVLVHGFKGYKDYGFIPLMAHDLCRRGVMVHRLNLSTSGMSERVEIFERPDLFALDTWARHVEDIVRTCRAIDEGEIKGAGLDRFLLGHSRGGASVLLSAGLHQGALGLSGVITLNAVDRCCRMSEKEQQEMLARGYGVSKSARTGQMLRIDAGWLGEQHADPDRHDVLLAASNIRVPVCVMHADRDDAVDDQAGLAIANAIGCAPVSLEGGNHVLNMPNPSELDTPRSEPFLKALDTISRFISKQSGADSV